MVWPGMKKVDLIPRRSSSRRIRGTATAPNSPREMGVGDVIPRCIHRDGPSKSNERQTYPLAFSGRRATAGKLPARCRSGRPHHGADDGGLLLWLESAESYGRRRG